MKKIFHKTGQNILEYALILSMVLGTVAFYKIKFERVSGKDKDGKDVKSIEKMTMSESFMKAMNGCFNDASAVLANGAVAEEKKPGPDKTKDPASDEKNDGGKGA